MTNPIKWIPLNYQKAGVRWLTSRPGAALFWAPGLKKTSTVYAAFLELVKTNFAKRMLVLAPLKVCQGVWRQEGRKWKQFAHLKVGFAHGPMKREIMADKSYDVVLLNYDAIPFMYNSFSPGDFDVVVYDELTRMKSHSSQRFKAWRVMLGYFKFRWGLTGTPAPNGLLDLFGQVFVIDGGQRLGTGITKFRFEYFHQKPFDKWTWYPNNDTPRRIVTKLKDLCNYIDEKEWNKMPALINVVREVELETKAMKEYKELEKQFIVKLEEGVVVASNAAVLSGKLRQCAGGAVYDDVRNVIPIHEAKLEALDSLIEELAGDPIIVVVGFLHEVEAIRKFLNKPSLPYLGGGVSDNVVEKIIRDWNLGWTPVLLVHPTSVAHGLNLQGGGRNICWYTLTWNAEEYEQLIRRLYRSGQEKHVMNYVLSAKGTIDTYIAGVLVDKDKVQQNLLQGLKRFYHV